MERFLIPDIHWHDSIICEVRITRFPDVVDMHLSYPVDWERDVYEPRIVRFHDAFAYQEHEGPFAGLATALEAKFEKDDRWIICRIETNAGYRQLHCAYVELLPSCDG